MNRDLQRFLDDVDLLLVHPNAAPRNRLIRGLRLMRVAFRDLYSSTGDGMAPDDVASSEANTVEKLALEAWMTFPEISSGHAAACRPLKCAARCPQPKPIQLLGAAS